MLGFSLPEILFLAILALVIIGPKQLPEVARTVGRFMNELRRTSNSFTEEFKSQMKIDPIRFDEKPKDTPPSFANHPHLPTEVAPESKSETKSETKSEDPGSEHT
jgi:sec-independent protein translocase protein TatB